MGLMLETEILLSLVRKPDHRGSTGSFFWLRETADVCLAEDCMYLLVGYKKETGNYQEMIRLFSNPSWRKKHGMEREDER